MLTSKFKTGKVAFNSIIKVDLYEIYFSVLVYAFCSKTLSFIKFMRFEFEWSNALLRVAQKLNKAKSILTNFVSTFLH